MSVRKNDQLEYLIVGQGIAGTLLTYFLLTSNPKVRVIDHPLPGATSKIAAGIINPITGRRFVKSWRFEELLPFAKNTYLEINDFLKISCWKDQNILRALPTVFEENEWLRRGVWPENEPYFCKEADLGAYQGKVKTERSWGEITGAAQVSLPAIIAHFRKYLLQEQLLMEEKFNFENLKVKDGIVNYQKKQYKKVIFCEGHRASENPYFNYLPFVPAKGECLLVRISNAHFKKMLKRHIFIVPQGGDLYWIGASNSFEDADPMPTDEKRAYLIGELNKILGVPFKLEDQFAGIRPTVADKRPFLGLHPHFSGLAIFNGLGTKGASLGPYFASQMAGYLIGKNELEEEVDIKRFKVKPV